MAYHQSDCTQCVASDLIANRLDATRLTGSVTCGVVPTQQHGGGVGPSQITNHRHLTYREYDLRRSTAAALGHRKSSITAAGQLSQKLVKKRQSGEAIDRPSQWLGLTGSAIGQRQSGNGWLTVEQPWQ